MRCLGGTEYNGALGAAYGRTTWGACVWLGSSGLSALNTIKLIPENGTLFNQYSHFALYGAK
jgi:hypothetical protein